MVSRYDALRLPRRCQEALRLLSRHGVLQKGSSQTWYAGDEGVCSNRTVRDLDLGGLLVAPGNVAQITPRGIEMLSVLDGIVPHTCHARGCETECKREHLMCSRHWRMVPRKIQNAVYDAYRPGQCDFEPLPSEAWHVAADAAIREVARIEEGQ